VPAGCIQPLLHLQLSVIAALPMQDSWMIAPSRRTMHLRECSAQNSLARRSCRGGVRPGAFEIGAQRQELLPFRLAKRGRTPRDHCRDVALEWAAAMARTSDLPEAIPLGQLSHRDHMLEL
jgi:hypothetical protein